MTRRDNSAEHQAVAPAVRAADAIFGLLRVPVTLGAVTSLEGYPAPHNTDIAAAALKNRLQEFAACITLVR